MRKLSDDQVEAFDTDYVDGARWLTVTARVDAEFPSGEFTFLDLGGGNGRFADKLLTRYPRAVGCVVDNSELLLSRNVPNDRKEICCESIGSLSRHDKKYDLVCVHWVLHHLVGESYRATRRHQLDALQDIRRLLTARGRISMFENNYSGWIFEDLPGRLIFFITSSKWLARVTRAMGANTGGVGVSFHSRSEWLETISRAMLVLREYNEPDPWTWPVSALRRLVLHLRQIRVGHYWLGV